MLTKCMLCVAFDYTLGWIKHFTSVLLFLFMFVDRAWLTCMELTHSSCALKTPVAPLLGSFWWTVMLWVGSIISPRQEYIWGCAFRKTTHMVRSRFNRRHIGPPCFIRNWKQKEIQSVYKSSSCWKPFLLKTDSEVSFCVMFPIIFCR